MTAYFGSFKKPTTPKASSKGYPRTDGMASDTNMGKVVKKVKAKVKK